MTITCVSLLVPCHPPLNPDTWEQELALQTGSRPILRWAITAVTDGLAHVEAVVLDPD
ncbi:MAG: hypothetical protein OHK0012_06250 [Synechococcales cyanobacterium]